MPVEYRLGGTRKRALREFYIHQHPGGSDASDIPSEMREAMGRHAQKASKRAKSGDWILYADGDPRVLDGGDFPTYISGDRVSGVEIYVLNEYYTADSSFEVWLAEMTNSRPREWVVEVDGRQVWTDEEFHPAYIGWGGGTSRSDVGSDTGFVFGDSFGAGSGDLGF
jgi:hypothetical protein